MRGQPVKGPEVGYDVLGGPALSSRDRDIIWRGASGETHSVKTLPGKVSQLWRRPQETQGAGGGAGGRGERLPVTLLQQEALLLAAELLVALQLVHAVAGLLAL